MTTTEIVLFIWLAFHSSVLIWLCFERDRLLKQINHLDAALKDTK